MGIDESTGAPPDKALPPENKTVLSVFGLSIKTWAVLLPGIFLVIFHTAATIDWLSQTNGLVDKEGWILGYDFRTFWSASYLALAGDPAAAYDHDLLAQIEAAPLNGEEYFMPWLYPPPFLLVVGPLALLPYGYAYFVWCFATLGMLAYVVYRIAPSPYSLWFIFSAPLTYWTFLMGQNGFLTAALLGGGLYWLERRPALSGISIGLLTIKPHLGLLFPLALLFGRYWRVFLWASATASVFALVATAYAGVEAWALFFDSVSYASVFLDVETMRNNRMPTVHKTLEFLRLSNGIDASPYFSFAAHYVVAAITLALVCWIWWRGAPVALLGAVLASGTALISPFLWDYDLMIYAVAIAFLGWDGMENGWLKGEKTVLAIAWILPFFARHISAYTDLQVGAFTSIALFAIAVRRALIVPKACSA